MEEIKEKLKAFADERFSFDAPSHSYTYGKKKLTSVTTFIKNFHQEFDSEKWSKIIAERRGVDVSVVIGEWDKKRDTSCDLGTDVHLYIENKFTPGSQMTREDFTDIETLSRIDKFEKLYASRLHVLTPVAQELRVFSERLGLAGTIDALFMKGDELFILDWKTNGKFKTDQDKCYQKMLPPFQDCWENELNKYSIQLNLYKLILAEKDIEVKDLAIVYIPPSVGEPKIYKAKNFEPQLRMYFGLDRKEKIERLLKEL